MVRLAMQKGKCMRLWDYTHTRAESAPEKIYAELRSTKKKYLTPSSLTGIRAALHRAIQSPPYNRSINIIADAAFNSVNIMLTIKCKQYVKNGNPKPKHKPAIGESDLKLLGVYFQGWMESPRVLQE